jgi:hypothetical protein
MTKIMKFICISAIVSIFTPILFSTIAHAGGSFDCLMCSSSTITPIVESADLTIMAVEYKGAIIDNTESKFFDNETGQGIGVMKIEKGKVTGSFWAKHLDPSGDFYVAEMSLAGREYDFRFIYGTGKFKGITGSGKAVPFTKGKPVSPGTAQNCSKVTGTYELKE